MAKAKPAAKGAKDAAKSPGDGTEKPKGGGLMSALPLAVVAGAATFGVVWFAAAPTPTEAVTCEASDGTEATAAAPVDEAELEARAAKYVSLEPFTTTLGPDAGARHLRMSISLGIPADAADLTDVDFLRLRDRFLERLRTVDTKLISDPSAMPALKDVLLVQAKATLGQDSVYNVLVTDFVMK